MRTKTWGAISTTALLAICGAAQGQAYSTNFEPATYTGSAGGTTVVGVDGWYLPDVSQTPGSTSIGGNVHTYAGNTYAVSANPQGGTQFMGGECDGTSFVRSQHDINFAAGGMWEATFDVNGQYSTAFGGVLPAGDNLGSWSLQVSALGARYFQTLLNWGSGAVAGIVACPGCPPLTNYAPTGDKYHMLIGYFTVASPATIGFEPPSTAFMDLLTNNWYRVSVKWNFTTAQILSASIQNLTTGGAATVVDLSARGMYLNGGPNSTAPLPTAVRLFTGSLVRGNYVAWDNMTVGPMAMGPTCYANCDASTAVPFLNVNDFICFNNRFAANDTYANCDLSTVAPVLNVNDFICFNNAFAAGCSAP